MKKIILTMMACAGLCACTNEEIVGPSGTTAADELGGPVAYITVNIKDVGSSTRADDGGFAYGTADEQTVANAYFYFYDDNGKYLARGSVASVSGTASEADQVTNIEWSSNTVVAVYGLEDVENLPTRMVTVLNQPDGFSGSHLSLSGMQAALAQATDGYADASTNAHFVMSTSSYYNAGVVNYTALSKDNFSLEPIDLTNDYGKNGTAIAVDVYVERLAAKVGVALAETLYDSADKANTLSTFTLNGYTYYDITSLVSSEFADNTATTNSIGLTILGWDINGTARDSYMLKNINDNSSWTNLSFEWNTPTSYRCYWAESPNYGVGGYPTSSVKEGKTVGNTDDDEADASTWLNEYLKYTSLSDPIEFGSYGYCAENTNTVDVLGDASSTGITNVLVKAQAAIIDRSSGSASSIALVKYRGEYYEAENFKNTVVSDVMAESFTDLKDDVVAYLKEYFSSDAAAQIIEDLADAVDPVIYCSKTQYTQSNYPSSTADLATFNGSFLELVNVGDGNINIWFKTSPVVWSNGTQVDKELEDKYNALTVVSAGEGLDQYYFYMHFDTSKLSTLEQALVNVVLPGGFFELAAGEGSLTLETEAGHTYDFRNYFLRAIEKEADGINVAFASILPIYYANGLMYYSIPIEHLGVEGSNGIAEGQYGVVRNHWYNITINYISNFGHGIADEAEVIVPQPEQDFYYLGATVNILSWRMINQTAGLK